jgi:hypothetical protein
MDDEAAKCINVSLSVLLMKRMEKTGKLFISQHCGHRWNYKGRKPRRYVTCPECRYNVKNIYFEEEEQKTNLDHFNIGENGVKIQDPSLATKYSPHGPIIDVYFRDGKAFCDYCESSDCKHVKYALSLPLVQRIFQKRRWKIE